VTASALRDAIRMSLEGMLPTNQSSPIVQEYNSSS
jgi:hypothetical protein